MSKGGFDIKFVPGEEGEIRCVVNAQFCPAITTPTLQQLEVEDLQFVVKVAPGSEPDVAKFWATMLSNFLNARLGVELSVIRSAAYNDGFDDAQVGGESDDLIDDKRRMVFSSKWS